jgi:RecA-family ATPase
MSDSFSNFFGYPVDIGYVLANEPPKLDYVLPDLPAGIVGKLIGPGGMGKTMLELEIAILSATGLLQRDHLFGPKSCDALTTAPQKVVLLAAEEPLVVLWQRVHHIVHSLKQREVLPEGISWLEFRDLLRANLLMFPLAGAKRVNLLTDDLQPSETALALGRLCEGVRLLIADPLRQLHLADENQSAPMSALMSVFKQIAHDSGAAVLVAHHTSRASSQPGYGGTSDSGRGSTALNYDSRWEIKLKKPTRETLDDYGISANQASQLVELEDVKNNYGATRDPVLLRRTAKGVLVPVEQPMGKTTVKRASRQNGVSRRSQEVQLECV